LRFTPAMPGVEVEHVYEFEFWVCPRASALRGMSDSALCAEGAQSAPEPCGVERSHEKNNLNTV